MILIWGESERASSGFQGITGGMPELRCFLRETEYIGLHKVGTAFMNTDLGLKGGRFIETMFGSVGLLLLREEICIDE